MLLMCAMFGGGLAAGLSVCQAQCFLSGHCVAEPNPDDPGLGEWRYCVTLSWDTGTQHAVSHLDLLLALEGCECVCEEFSFGVPDTAGSSTGVLPTGAPCTVCYYAEFECYGDPSIGVAEPLVKFDPYDDDCGPDATGSGTFCFYTDWPPIPVELPNGLLALKAAGDTCFGELTGELPECICGGTPTQDGTWGKIKAWFRH